MDKKEICVRSVLWIFFNVGLCLSPFAVAMLVTDNFSLAGLHKLTIKGELLLLGIGIAAVAIGEWLANPPDTGVGKVVIGLLFLLFVTAFYCYIETAKISSTFVETTNSLPETPKVQADLNKGLKIIHTLSLFGGISVCSFVCMCYCWANSAKK